MKHMLDKLAKKDKSDSKSSDHSDAKMQVLQELRDMAMGMMGSKLKDKMPKEMHGVEIMAPDKEGLQEGLELAQEALPHSGDGQPDRSHALSPDADLSEDRLENPGEAHDDMDDDELDSMIAELQAKKAARNPRFQS